MSEAPTVVTDGELRGARRTIVGESTILTGRIYGDRKGRFADGEWVHTSRILEELPGDVFRTRNSTYVVTSWAAA